MKRVLVLGVGNPGRRDDGLGPALAERIEALGLPHVSVDSGYQLTVEDSAAAAEHDVLVIADADAAGPEPYSFGPIRPSERLEFSSHSVQPGGVLGLCQTAFGRSPEAFVLGIRGYEFDPLVEGLTEKARANLDEAERFLKRFLIAQGEPAPAGFADA